MRKRTPRFFGLDRFGITDAGLRRLGARRVTVEVEIGIPPYVYPSPAWLRRLLRMKPSQRHELARQWRRRKFAALLKELPPGEHASRTFEGGPYLAEVTLPARHLGRLRRLRHAWAIRVRSVEGVRKRSLPNYPRLYAVKGRMVFQVEGQTRGMQLCEERITVVMARTERQAQARVARLMTQGTPYLSTSGHFLRWKFDGVTDVCECPDETFASQGTEVFYSYRRRRVRAEHEWHPSRVGRRRQK